MLLTVCGDFSVNSDERRRARAQQPGRVDLRSRNGRSLREAFPEIAGAIRMLPRRLIEPFISS